MAEPIDWDVIAQRIATEAGILDAERIGGITAENFEAEIASQTGQVASEVAQGIMDKGYTYESTTDVFSEQQVAARDGDPSGD